MIIFFGLIITTVEFNVTSCLYANNKCIFSSRKYIIFGLQIIVANWPHCLKSFQISVIMDDFPTLSPKKLYNKRTVIPITPYISDVSDDSDSDDELTEKRFIPNEEGN